MVDVERLRRVAVKRQEQGLVGMILTVDQVLGLIARGDARQLAYQVRIQDLEGEVRRLREGGSEVRRADREQDDGLVRIGEAAKALGLPVSTIGTMVRRKIVYSERRETVAADGSTRRLYFVDPDEVEAYAELSHREKIALRRAARGEVV